MTEQTIKQQLDDIDSTIMYALDCETQGNFDLFEQEWNKATDMLIKTMLNTRE